MADARTRGRRIHVMAEHRGRFYERFIDEAERIDRESTPYVWGQPDAIVDTTGRDVTDRKPPQRPRPQLESGPR